MLEDGPPPLPPVSDVEFSEKLVTEALREELEDMMRQANQLGSQGREANSQPQNSERRVEEALAFVGMGLATAEAGEVLSDAPGSGPLSPMPTAPADMSTGDGLHSPALNRMPAASPGAIAEAAILGAFVSGPPSDGAPAEASDKAYDGLTLQPFETVDAFVVGSNAEEALVEPEMRETSAYITEEAVSSENTEEIKSQGDDPAELVVDAALPPPPPLESIPQDDVGVGATLPPALSIRPLQTPQQSVAANKIHSGTQTPPRGQDVATSTAFSQHRAFSPSSPGPAAPHHPPYGSMPHPREDLQHLRSYTGEWGGPLDDWVVSRDWSGLGFIGYLVLIY